MREEVSLHEQQWRFHNSEKGGGQKLQKGRCVEERQSGSEGFCEEGIGAAGRCVAVRVRIYTRTHVPFYTGS